MKKLILGVLAASILFAPGFATADSWQESAKVRSWDDLSWWAQSGSTPDPVKDSRRSGYWWWPTDPASNVDDEELWGNRGVVFGLFEPPLPPPPPEPVAAPDIPAAPRPTRSIPVFNHVLFDFDEAVLKAEGKTEVDRVIAMMNEHSGDTVVIEGHTCSVGEADYNMGLGQRRSNAVMQYMVSSGIAASRLSSESRGESQAAMPNDTPANRKLNRRAMFRYSMAD